MNEASISALLQFLYTDSWEGPGEDDGLAFRVFALADRYQLTKLVDIAEGKVTCIGSCGLTGFCDFSLA